MNWHGLCVQAQSIGLTHCPQVPRRSPLIQLGLDGHVERNTLPWLYLAPGLQCCGFQALPDIADVTHQRHNLGLPIARQRVKGAYTILDSNLNSPRSYAL